MPQTNYLPVFTATYPLLAKVQKPGGILGTQVRTASAGSWAANVATLTFPAVVDYVGATYQITVAGFTPAGYNGVYQGTIASSTTMTYPLPTNPGGVTSVQGTVTYTAIIPLVPGVAVGAGDVPNKPTYTAGTIQMVGAMVEEAKVEETKAEEPVAEEEHVEEEDEDDDDDPSRTVRRTTRTTTRRR
jgi:hypothetical protein